MSHHPRLAYVLLAAGSSKRFGSCKQLAEIDFKNTMLEHSLATALDFSPGEVFLVLGAYQEKILERLNIDEHHSRIHLVLNNDWKNGLSSSIISALKAIDKKQYEGICILLADQVAINASQLKDMRELWYQSPDKIVAAKYRGILGAPAIFPKALIPNLYLLTGDTGARSVIEAHVKKSIGYDLEEARWDIDTEMQLSDYQIDSL